MIKSENGRLLNYVTLNVRGRDIVGFVDEARMGVTGMRNELALEHSLLFAELRQLEAPPPILGFGISTPEHVRQAIAAGAAGVISGSAIVRLVDEPGQVPCQIATFVATMKGATRYTELPCA